MGNEGNKVIWIGSYVLVTDYTIVKYLMVKMSFCEKDMKGFTLTKIFELNKSFMSSSQFSNVSNYCGIVAEVELWMLCCKETNECLSTRSVIFVKSRRYNPHHFKPIRMPIMSNSLRYSSVLTSETFLSGKCNQFFIFKPFNLQNEFFMRFFFFFLFFTSAIPYRKVYFKDRKLYFPTSIWRINLTFLLHKSYQLRILYSCYTAIILYNHIIEVRRQK